jgi:hypothetical protein
VIVAPTAAATVSGTITVTGTAADNVQVTAVAVSVDNGPFAAASGTTSWSYSLDTTPLTAGTHTISARASDSSGNTTVSSVGVSVKAAADSTPPTISITAPVAGSTVGGTITVKGAATDNQAINGVQLSVDGGPYQPASGTSSWSVSLSTNGYANGSHKLTARVVDATGNSATTTDTVSFSNTVADTTPPSVAINTPAAGATVSGAVTVSGTASDNVAVAKVELSVDGGAYQPVTGTSSWSLALASGSYADGAHTITARATDSSGNQTTASESLTFSNTSSSNSGQTLVTPEGATIEVAPDVSGWTPAQVYALLQANAYELNLIGSSLTVQVQTQYATDTSTGVSQVAGVYQNYHAIIYLQATANSVFTARPDYAVAHEYGHAWSTYHLYMTHSGDWSSWLNFRGLTGNPLLDSSLSWDRSEMIADDYRMLFGSPAAVSEAAYINPQVADPRTVPGLHDFLANTWG